MSINNHRLIKYLNLVMLLIILVTVNVSALAQDKIMAIPQPGVDSISQPAVTDQLKSTYSATLFSPKIVGGITARRGEFPEFVLLFIEGAAIGLDPNFLYAWCVGLINLVK